MRLGGDACAQLTPVTGWRCTISFAPTHPTIKEVVIPIISVLFLDITQLIQSKSAFREVVFALSKCSKHIFPVHKST